MRDDTARECCKYACKGWQLKLLAALLLVSGRRTVEMANGQSVFRGVHDKGRFYAHFEGQAKARQSSRIHNPAIVPIDLFTTALTAFRTKQGHVSTLTNMQIKTRYQPMLGRVLKMHSADGGALPVVCKPHDLRSLYVALVYASFESPFSLQRTAMAICGHACLGESLSYSNVRLTRTEALAKRGSLEIAPYEGDGEDGEDDGEDDSEAGDADAAHALLVLGGAGGAGVGGGGVGGGMGGDGVGGALAAAWAVWAAWAAAAWVAMAWVAALAAAWVAVVAVWAAWVAVWAAWVAMAAVVAVWAAWVAMAAAAGWRWRGWRRGWRCGRWWRCGRRGRRCGRWWRCGRRGQRRKWWHR